MRDMRSMSSIAWAQPEPDHSSTPAENAPARRIRENVMMSVRNPVLTRGAASAYARLSLA